MIDPERIQRLAAKIGNRNDALELVRQMRCGGKKYPGGGKFFRTNLQQESPMMYQPMIPINYPIETPLRFRPEPDLGDYRAPESTGMIVNYPINTPSRTPVIVQESVPAPMVIEDESIGDLFSDEAKARRLLRQRYAESVFDDKAVSNAGARGAWQIMPITYKDYLTRGRGKEGDLDEPDYNRLVRDHTFRMIPRDLEEIWDENYSDRNKLALLYAGYNRGANGLKKYLRGLVKKGVDISKPENWVEGMNPETRNYVHFLAYDEDVPGTYLMNEKFEKAARAKGYMAKGGRLFEDGGPYGVIPLGGDYLTYLQTMPEVSGGVIEPSVVTAALPAKFNGSQASAARYAEGYQKGAKPVTEAMNRAGRDIFNTVDTVVGLTPTPAGALTWLGHMGADAAEGEWGKVGRDVLIATALGAGARGIGWLRNYVDDATNFGEDIFRAFTDRVPGRVSTNFTYSAPATRVAVEAVPAVANAASAPYEIADLGGGYMLKSLMRGNPLEKQISKNGMVNVNNVRALVGKGSKVEQAVVDRVLASEEFAGKKSIDYNKFRKAVQDELITYDRTPDTRWSNYGMGRIGQGMDGSPNARRAVLDAKTHMDRFNAIDVYGTPTERSSVRNLTFDLREGKISESEYDEKFNSIYNGFSDRIVGNATPETFIFSSSRIPSGSSKHYDRNTLGHSRTYTTADEPDVLHVMESQSDWAQTGGGKKNSFFPKEEWEELIADKEKELSALERSPEPEDKFGWEALERIGKIDKLKIDIADAKIHRDNANRSWAEQVSYLGNDYTSRQIQENLRYAAEKGQTKMRYPTRETAAKIEGYPEVEMYVDERGIKHNTPYEYDQDIKAKLDAVQQRFDEISRSTNESDMPEYERLSKELSELSDAYANSAVPIKNAKKVVSYANEHEGILKKYDAFPRQYKKLYKNADVRIVTDPKGNTWYEVDVPENYLEQEWAYEEGGSLVLPKMMIDKHSPDKLRKAIASIKAKRMQ